MSKKIKASIVIRFSPTKEEKIDILKKLLIEANLARIAESSNPKFKKTNT